MESIKGLNLNFKRNKISAILFEFYSAIPNLFVIIIIITFIFLNIQFIILFILT